MKITAKIIFYCLVPCGYYKPSMKITGNLRLREQASAEKLAPYLKCDMFFCLYFSEEEENKLNQNGENSVSFITEICIYNPYIT